LGHAVAQFVTTRKVAGSIPDRVIDIILPVALACNRNEYQEYFLGVKAAGA